MHLIIGRNEYRMRRYLVHGRLVEGLELLERGQATVFVDLGYVRYVVFVGYED